MPSVTDLSSNLLIGAWCLVTRHVALSRFLSRILNCNSRQHKTEWTTSLLTRHVLCLRFFGLRANIANLGNYTPTLCPCFQHHFTTTQTYGNPLFNPSFHSMLFGIQVIQAQISILCALQTGGLNRHINRNSSYRGTRLEYRQPFRANDSPDFIHDRVDGLVGTGRSTTITNDTSTCIIPTTSKTLKFSASSYWYGRRGRSPLPSIYVPNILYCM